LFLVDWEIESASDGPTRSECDAACGCNEDAPLSDVCWDITASILNVVQDYASTCSLTPGAANKQNGPPQPGPVWSLVLCHLQAVAIFEPHSAASCMTPGPNPWFDPSSRPPLRPKGFSLISDHQAESRVRGRNSCWRRPKGENKSRAQRDKLSEGISFVPEPAAECLRTYSQPSPSAAVQIAPQHTCNPRRFRD